jgi:hypothetical protein
MACVRCTRHFIAVRMYVQGETGASHLPSFVGMGWAPHLSQKEGKQANRSGRLDDILDAQHAAGVNTQLRSSGCGTYVHVYVRNMHIAQVTSACKRLPPHRLTSP